MRSDLPASVQVRHRGSWDFNSYYESQCALLNTCPLQAAIRSLPDLQLNGDRIQVDDWPPLLNSIAVCRTLERLDISWRCSKKSLVVNLSKLFSSIGSCLQGTVETLVLSGLPRISGKEIRLLELSKASSLRSLSFSHSILTENAVHSLCGMLRKTVLVTHLDLSHCELSSNCCEDLSALIESQSSLRHCEAWQDSLRYRRPNLDSPRGIRRLNISHNALIGDAGAITLATSLRDDIWLRAIDMQSCGITTEGAKALLDVVRFSSTIVVCDVRQNPFAESSVVRSIMEQCLLNTQGIQSEAFPWLSVETEKKSPVKIEGVRSAPRPTMRNSRRKPKVSSVGRFSRVKIPVQTGFPWHTALRMCKCANREVDMTETPRRKFKKTDRPHKHEDVSLSEDSVSLDRKSPHVILDKEFTRKLKEAEESNANLRNERRMLELEMENRRLRRELASMRYAQQNEVQNGRSLSDNEDTLACIEDTFNRFNRFLDLLSDHGLGHLAELAGLDQTNVTIQQKPKKIDNEFKILNGKDSTHDNVISDIDKLESDSQKSSLYDKHSPKKSSHIGPCGDVALPKNRTESLIEEVERLAKEELENRRLASLESPHRSDMFSKQHSLSEDTDVHLEDIVKTMEDLSVATGGTHEAPYTEDFESPHLISISETSSFGDN